MVGVCTLASQLRDDDEAEAEDKVESGNGVWATVIAATAPSGDDSIIGARLAPLLFVPLPSWSSTAEEEEEEGV